MRARRHLVTTPSRNVTCVPPPLSGEAKAACADIGKQYGKSAAQVGLRFLADQGVAFTTQTKSRSHFEERLDTEPSPSPSPPPSP